MNAAPARTDADKGADIPALEAALGYVFRRREFLSRALIHSSACAGGTAESNERLEFLGDRVLGLAAADMLLERLPHESEGGVSRRYSALVRKETLAEIACEIDLGRYITAAKNVRKSPSMLADALEAVAGAVYLDGGWAPAKALVSRFWAARLDAAAVGGPPQDAKSRLQERLQAENRPLPEYCEVTRKGPPQAPVFTVEARAGGAAALGEGRSKRAAEQDAARRLLKKLGSGAAP